MLNSSNLQKKIIAYFLLPEFRTRFPATQKIHKVLHAIHTLQILERINMTDNTVEKKTQNGKTKNILNILYSYIRGIIRLAMRKCDQYQTYQKSVRNGISPICK